MSQVALVVTDVPPVLFTKCAAQACIPERVRPALHESGALHGQVDVPQAEVEGVGEGDGGQHGVLHPRETADLQTRGHQPECPTMVRKSSGVSYLVPPSFRILNFIRLDQLHLNPGRRWRFFGGFSTNTDLTD